MKIVDSSLRHATEPIPHQISPVRRRTIAQELDGARLERLRSKKKARSGFAANVSVKIREITELLTDNRSLSTVKEKLSTVYFDYWSKVKDGSGITECRDYWVKQNENFGFFSPVGGQLDGPCRA